MQQHPQELNDTVLEGRYELHAVIGEGAFGRVYRGLDRRLARTVAIKVIKSPWGDDPKWVESFEQEARLLACVSDPRIVQIFDVGHAPEGLYYVAEFVDGESLASRLARGPLAPRDACEVAEQLCRALAHAHAQRIVHRDIKPANILISKQGQVKVGDFGIARLAESTTEIPAAAIVGTPKYMAPEQARGLRTTPAVDIYSVGVVLYEMLAGRPPFSGATSVELAMAHAYDRPGPLPVDTPRELVNVVTRALAKDPAERYRDATSMAQALAHVRASAREQEPTEHAPMLDEELRTVSLPALAASRPARTHPERTRIAPLRPSAAREYDPVAQRRNLAVLLAGCAIVLAMIAGAILLPGSSPAPVKTPDLSGLSRVAIGAQVRRAGLRARYAQTYNADVRAGTAISQRPAAGASAARDSTVRVLLSEGPPPVEVPRLVGQSASAAGVILASLGLSSNLNTVPAPGTTPGLVTAQAPSSGSYVHAHDAVALSVAETPSWRALTSLAGDGGGHTVPFRVLGSRFRIAYRLSYDGMCTFIFFCEGPSARIVNLTTGATVSQFGLRDGGAQNHVIDAGAGLYQLSISPGADTASWSLTVDDYY